MHRPLRRSMVTVPLVQQGLLLLLISQLCVAAPDIPWQVGTELAYDSQVDFKCRYLNTLSGSLSMQAYHNTSHILESFKAASSLTANLARYSLTAESVPCLTASMLGQQCGIGTGIKTFQTLITTPNCLCRL